MHGIVSITVALALASPVLAQAPAPIPPSQDPTYPIEPDPEECCEDEHAIELALEAEVALRVTEVDLVEYELPASEADACSDSAPVSRAEEEGECAIGLTGDWGGWRKSLEDKGISIGASLILDLHRIESGGIERGEVGHTLWDLTTTFDLSTLAGIDDAVIVANAYLIHGRNPSDLTGDYQSFSSISADHTDQLGQLYYEQYLFDEQLRIKVGKADANVDFAVPDSSGEFLHSAAFFSPTTHSMPTYPNPATLVAAFWQPNENWSVALGIYDGAGNTGVNTGSRGPSTFFGAPSDLYVIGEATYRWTTGKDGLAGRFTLGGFRHTGEFARFAGGTDDGTGGWYAIADHELARIGGGDAPGTLAAFAQWGYADDDVAEVDQHLGAGLVANGCCGRPDDSIGFYMSSVGFSEGLGTTANRETALECYYKRQVRSWLVLKPDLQYITNPSGDATLDDAFVLSLRAQVDF